VQRESYVHSRLQHSSVMKSDRLNDFTPHVQQGYRTKAVGLFEKRVQLAQLWHGRLIEVRQWLDRSQVLELVTKRL
jgi:hypothetical protein